MQLCVVNRTRIRNGNEYCTIRSIFITYAKTRLLFDDTNVINLILLNFNDTWIS